MFKKAAIFFCIFISETLAFRIGSAANACARLIQPPGSTGDVEIFKKDLDINCYDYYNVISSPEIINDILYSYGQIIDLTRQYEKAYVNNEHIEYMSKSWLSMIAADPLSSIQRQAKECNSHILKTFISNEDVRGAGPIFKNELMYLGNCLNDTYDFSSSQAVDILNEFDGRIENVSASQRYMKESSDNLTNATHRLLNLRPLFIQNLIENFNRVNSAV